MENKESKKENDDEMTYVTHHHADKLEFSVESRQEAIDKITEVINGFKHDYRFMINLWFLCAGEPTLTRRCDLHSNAHELLVRVDKGYPQPQSGCDLS